MCGPQDLTLYLKETNTMIQSLRKFLREWFPKKRPFKRNRSTRVLTFEVLEARVTPAVSYTWTGGAGNSAWENEQNWDPVGFPGMNNLADDTATINGARTVTMGAFHTLASLTLGVAGNNFTGTLTLNNTLTLSNGGSMSGGTIVQKTANNEGRINITGGTFNWSGGNINYGPNTVTGPSTVTIGAQATLNVQDRA
jgi:hypothetical protein